MSAKTRARARSREDRAGDPLDGLVNLFDLGTGPALASRIGGAERALRWRLRDDLRGKSLGLALFGHIGTTAPPGLRTAPPAALPDDLVTRAVSVFGYEVLPAPPPG